jgi:dTDP-glucose pyrophosphorylase
MLHKLVLKPDTTFEEAVKALDINGNGFLPIVDEYNKLIGILTDGDIRRAIIRNERNLQNIINKHPTTVGKDTPRTDIERQLRTMRRRHMPVVDEQGKFIEVIILNDFSEKIISNHVVIMAGGMGTRLGTLTKDTPKPMLNVNGKPILHRVIEAFKKLGFNNFIFCLNYRSDIIKDYFKDGSQFSVSITYTLENKRLGTAGALSLIPKATLKEPFIVTNADILTSFNYENLLDFHIKSHAAATMCVKQHSLQLPYANVISDETGNLIALEEKPLVPFFINAGIYALSPDVLNHVPHDEYFDMTSLFQELINKEKSIKTYKMEDYWVDIGLPAEYNKAIGDTLTQ